MEKNCLTTKLGSAINNGDLNKRFECLYLYVVPGTAIQMAVGLSAVINNTSEVFEDGDREKSLGVIPTINGFYIHPSLNVKYIEITNRSNIKAIYGGSNYAPSLTSDIFEQLKYCINLQEYKPVGVSHTIVYTGLMDTYSGMFDCGRRNGELVTTLKVIVNGATIQSPTAVFGENDVKIYNTDKSTLLATYDGTEWSYPS